MNSTKNIQITCDHLVVGYDKKIIINNLNFNINEGDFICIVGENGIGKSSLIKTILGLTPSLSGTIKLENNLKRTDIGYLPQQTQIQRDFPATVMEIVLSGTINKHHFRPFYNKKDKELAKQALNKLNIIDLSSKSYAKLSGGQQQRALLARAFCAANKIILLDEPMSGLDETTSKKLYQTLKQLNDDGITIVMITHEPDKAIPLASHILLIDDNPRLLTKNEYHALIKEVYHA